MPIMKYIWLLPVVLVFLAACSIDLSGAFTAETKACVDPVTEVLPVEGALSLQYLTIAQNIHAVETRYTGSCDNLEETLHQDVCYREKGECDKITSCLLKNWCEHDKKPANYCDTNPNNNDYCILEQVKTEHGYISPENNDVCAKIKSSDVDRYCTMAFRPRPAWSTKHIKISVKEGLI
jgi:hypothetical protein